MTRRRVCIPLLAALLPVSALAADPVRQQPVQLRADRIEIDQRSGVSRYLGRVVVIQGDLRLTADRAEARQRHSQIETIIAYGQPVTFRDRPPGQEQFIEGKALRAEYQAQERQLHLHGAVDLNRGTDRVRAAVIHYDMNSEIVQAESGDNQRVVVTLKPHRPENRGDKVPE